jgi:hypothetical protein
LTKHAVREASTEDGQKKKKTHRGKRGGRKCKKSVTAVKGANAREDVENVGGDTTTADESVTSNSDGEWEVVVEEAREVTKSWGDQALQKVEPDNRTTISGLAAMRRGRMTRSILSITRTLDCCIAGGGDMRRLMSWTSQSDHHHQ